MSYQNYQIAVLVPCHNEAITIADVIHNFHTAIPHCRVYVYDNNSTDKTAEIAQECGAIVRYENNKGKGNVVRRMFADIDADIYILVDGDNTYDASVAPMLVDTLIYNHLDMVVGARVENSAQKVDDKYATYRPGHRFANSAFSRLIAKLFGKKFNDVFSGYRVFSRRFVKSFPATSHGFDIETELTVHSLELRIPTTEIATPYGSRPEGSTSKLSSYKDGFKILFRILLLLKEVRPLFFFGSLFLLFAAISIGIFIPVLTSYLHTGLVHRIPTAILSTGLMILGFMSLGCGLILDNVCRSRREMKRFVYLSLPRYKYDEKIN